MQTPIHANNDWRDWGIIAAIWAVVTVVVWVPLLVG